MIGHVVFVGGVLAQSDAAKPGGGCWSIKEDKGRLACYDKGSPSSEGTPAASTSVEEKTPATTKDVLGSYGPGDYKIVDADDLYVAPKKYTGKPIEVKNMSCFYADKDEYRCIASTGLTVAVFALTVEPPAEKSALEDSCGTIKQLDKPSCRKTIRLVPLGYDSDTVNGNQKRIVLFASAIEIMPPKLPARR
jgi:hypothetical protein